MRLISLNVGLPREVEWHGMTVATGIFKEPVSGRRQLRTLNLDGDRQADLSVHGGADKAVYCYPSEHYEWWARDLQYELGRELPFGMFGENFTTVGLVESEVHIGDRFALGTTEVMVTQPRTPCYKLGIRFDDDHMVKRFLAAGRSGFYVSVTREGEVGAGDEIRLVTREAHAVPVSVVAGLYARKEYSEEDARWLELAQQVAALPENWKRYFRERLTAAGS